MSKISVKTCSYVLNYMESLIKEGVEVGMSQSDKLLKFHKWWGLFLVYSLVMIKCSRL